MVPAVVHRHNNQPWSLHKQDQELRAQRVRNYRKEGARLQGNFKMGMHNHWIQQKQTAQPLDSMENQLCKCWSQQKSIARLLDSTKADRMTIRYNGIWSGNHRILRKLIARRSDLMEINCAMDRKCRTHKKLVELAPNLLQWGWDHCNKGFTRMKKTTSLLSHWEHYLRWKKKDEVSVSLFFLLV